MLIEQAFMNLPEILTGNGFPSQDYEGGIVGAFGMALLQELNGRNVNNPISVMQMEKPFRDRKKPFKDSTGKARYLRCDIHIQGKKIGIGSELLAKYGWRHSNWVEAKFFRAFDKKGLPKKATNQATNTAELLADLIRLLALVPKTESKNLDICGRYLLHVYLREPGDHLSISRRKDGADIERPWLKGILTPGFQEVAEFEIGDEAPNVLDAVGNGLAPLKVKFQATNFLLKPVAPIGTQRLYECHLTRIESFKLTSGDDWLVSELDRKIDNSKPTGNEKVADFVGKHISVKAKSSDEIKPDISEKTGSADADE